MPIHTYTPSQALELLIRKLQEKDTVLAQNIQSIIDSGKDVQEEQAADGRGRRKRVYRRTVPFTTEEALQVALKALESYFVEIPLFINSTSKNFKKSGLIDFIENDSQQNSARETNRASLLEVNEKKRIVFELQTETQISRNEQQLLSMSVFTKKQIDQQNSNFARIKDLINFTED